MLAEKSLSLIIYKICKQGFKYWLSLYIYSGEKRYVKLLEFHVYL